MSGTISNQRIWAVVLLTSFGWGTAPVLIRVALDEGLEPLAITAANSIIAAIAVMVFLGFVRSGVTIGRIELRIGAVMSILSVVLPFLSRNLALEYASAGFVSLMTALVPLITAVGAHFVLADEPLKAATVGGLVLGLAGVAALVLSGDSGIGEGGNPAIATGYALIGVVSVSAGAVYAKRHAGEYSVLGVSGTQFVIGSVLASIAMLIGEGIPANPTGTGWLSLIYIGVIGTFMPVALYYWLLRHVTVTYSTIIGYVVPFVAVVVGIIALGEQLQPGIILGGALIFAGVVITDWLRIR
ncbi:MAG: DMT family transporter, partial [Acidimicrobiia bacterium]|nr:DMT family transporter [Acidimicrobiia bacterium]